MKMNKKKLTYKGCNFKCKTTQNSRKSTSNFVLINVINAKQTVATFDEKIHF